VSQPVACLFIPVAMETSSAFGDEAAAFLLGLGHRIAAVKMNSRSTSFLPTRLSGVSQFSAKTLPMRSGNSRQPLYSVLYLKFSQTTFILIF
jgi:hypothetical protein